jgi:Restriction endonuclease
MILQNLIDLSPGEFEVFVTNLLRKMGYKAETTRLTADGGIDVWASNDNLFTGGKIIVQCKRYSENNMVGEPVLRELFGLIHAHGVNKGVLVTTSSFTRGAMKFAQGKPIELLGGVQLLGLCQQENFNVPAATLAWSDVGDELEALSYLDRWNMTDPLPYSLQFNCTSNNLLNEVDIWNLDDGSYPLGDAILRADYFLAVNHLLQGSIFREAEPTHVDIGAWSRQRVGVICRSYRKYRQTNPDSTEYEEKKMSSLTIDQRIEWSIRNVQSLIQPLCLRYWWKPDTDSIYASMRQKQR